jgi:hypothetical protein
MNPPQNTCRVRVMSLALSLSQRSDLINCICKLCNYRLRYRTGLFQRCDIIICKAQFRQNLRGMRT